jgi:nucleoside-diphosphate-sugar epimerase
MASEKGTIAITGATGYVGRATVAQAIARGFRVRALGRRPLEFSNAEFVRYDLADIGAIDALAGCRAVIHLAADTAARNTVDPEFELRAAERIIDASAKHGARLVYVSSQTAKPDAESSYARSKWLVEQAVRAGSACIIRSGLVYGGEEKGLFGELCNLVRRLPILPALVPAAKVQPIHVRELVDGLLNAVEQEWNGTRNFARVEPMSFTAFLRILARERLRKRRLFLPFPVALLIVAEPLFKRLIPKGPQLGQLRSLYATPIIDTLQDLKAAAIFPRPVTHGMHPSGNGRRRMLIAEADTLLAYILRRRGPPALLRRYVRAVEALDGGHTLSLPRMLHRFPFLAALFDYVGAVGTTSKLGARIAWATRIAEASVPGSRRFLPAEKSYRPVRAILTIGWAVLAESFFRLARVVFERSILKAAQCAEKGPP